MAKDTNKPYTRTIEPRTNIFRAVRSGPRETVATKNNFPTGRMSGNYSPKMEFSPVKNQENIFKDSMSRMFIDDFWTSFKTAKSDEGSMPKADVSTERNSVSIERSKENIYNSTVKTYATQEKLKETPPPSVPSQPQSTSPRGGGGGGGGGGSVSMSGTSTVQQVILAAVMLPRWRQAFTG